MWQVSKSADPDQTPRQRRGGWSGSTLFAYVQRSLFAWRWLYLYQLVSIYRDKCSILCGHFNQVRQKSVSLVINCQVRLLYDHDVSRAFRTSGQCRKCIYNTAGMHCDKCLPNFFGDALADEKGDCQGESQLCTSIEIDRPLQHMIYNSQMSGNNIQWSLITTSVFAFRHFAIVTKVLLCYETTCARLLTGFMYVFSACNCYPPGTINPGVLNCSPEDGQCPCLPNVRGRRCDECEVGYWNLDSAQGKHTPPFRI